MAVLCLLMVALGAEAGTHTWTGGSTDGRWSVGSNWEGGSPPFANEAPLHLVFPSSATRKLATNNIGNISIDSITFGGAAYTIAASGSGTNVTFNSSVGHSWWNVRATNGTGHTLHYSMNLALDGNLEFNISTNCSVVVRSRLSAAAPNSGLSKNGPGSVDLDPIEDNTFDGMTTVNDGALFLQGSHLELGFSVADITVPGSLVIGNTSSTSHPRCFVNFGHQIADTSPVTVHRNGELVLVEVNDTIGSLTLIGGYVEAFNSTLGLNGNVLAQDPGTAQPGEIRGRVNLGNIGRFFTVESNAWLDVNAIISGGNFGNVPAGFLKNGPGLMSLSSSSNTFGGDIYVSAGTLSINNTKQLGAVTNGTGVASNATLALTGVGTGPIVNGETLDLAQGARLKAWLDSEWNGPVQLYGQAIIEIPSSTTLLSLGGVVSGVGGITKTGDGVLRFTGSSANTFAGGLVAEDGEVNLAKSSGVTSVPGPLIVGSTNNGGTIASVVLGNHHQIANDAIVTIQLFSHLDSANFSDVIGDLELYGGALTSTGTGLWTLGGQVNIHYADWPGVFSGRVSVGSVLRTFHSGLYGGLLVTAPLVGAAAGGVLKTGPGSLSFFSTNTYPGLTKVEEGTLFIVLEGQPGSTAAGTEIGPNGILRLVQSSVVGEHLTLDGNGTNPFSLISQDTNVWQGAITLIGGPNIRSYTNDSRLILSGPMLGTSGVGFDGPGTVVYSSAADNTYQGNTVVNQGTLVLGKLNATAIPGNLVIGSPTNGAPAAAVVCEKASQFAPVTVATLPSLLVTVNPLGGLHLGGFHQFIANIVMVGGTIFTETGFLYLHGNFTVQPNPNPSSFYGKLALANPFADHIHQMKVEADSSLLFWGDISQGVVKAHLQKLGSGELSMLSSNSFDGNFIISGGRVLAGGVQPFATVNGVTIVQDGATVMVFGGAFAEPFSLQGNGHTNQGALVARGTNNFNGTMSLAADATVSTPFTTNVAIVTGVINGPGGLTKVGPGTLRMAGSSDNTFTGKTRVQQGALELTKTNATALVGALDIAVGSGDGLVRYLRPAQIGDLTPVSIGTNGQFRLLGHSDTIGSLAGYGIVELLGGSLIVGNDNTATTYAGVISGIGGIGGTLTKTGTNSFTLAGNNAYTGDTFVKGGTLFVRGQQPLSDVTIQTGGTLGGTGAVGVISDLSGHVKPGVANYGILKCAGFLTHVPANQFQVEINGTTPGLNCDQLDVAGPVTLLGGTLQVAMNFPGAVSNEYVIVKNDGADTVTGTFIGLSQNAMLTNNGVTFQITYHGGDGNDIALIQQTLALGPQIGGITKLNDGTVQITVQGQPNATYTVEATESLSPPIDWNEIGNATANAAGQFSFIDPDAPQHPIRFYRFRLP